MKEDPDGWPATGPSARLLGVRPATQPTPDVLATKPTDVVHPGQGGMSVAPDDPTQLRRHRRPVSLGGIGLDPVWYIEMDELVPDLAFRQDKATHGVIEPKYAMTLQEFQSALAQTRSLWRMHCR
jgi:hypothetical protein